MRPVSNSNRESCEEVAGHPQLATQLGEQGLGSEWPYPEIPAEWQGSPSLMEEEEGQGPRQG